MNGIKILGTGTYTPDFVVTNQDFEALVETSDEWIYTRTGMRRRHVSNGEPSWYMGAKAARLALERSGVAPEEVDAIIVSTATPDMCFPSIGCMIQRDLGAYNAFAFDISVACAGITYTLDMAWRYLSTGGASTVLLVGAENLTQFLDYSDRSTCVLFGDGAGACVVRAGEGDFHSYLVTDGRGAHSTYMKRKRRSLPFDMPQQPEQELFPTPVEDSIFMNGREVYKFATRAMPQAIEAVCAKAGITPRNLDLIIPHQANARIIEAAARHLDVDMDKICVNVDEYANTSSASIYLCMDESIQSGRLKRGDRLCLVGFGGGLTLGANLFVY